MLALLRLKRDRFVRNCLNKAARERIIKLSSAVPSRIACKCSEKETYRRSCSSDAAGSVPPGRWRRALRSAARTASETSCKSCSAMMQQPSELKEVARMQLRNASWHSSNSAAEPSIQRLITIVQSWCVRRERNVSCCDAAQSKQPRWRLTSCRAAWAAPSQV